MKIPWKDAAVHEGTIPQQKILYPHPVILECGDCHWTGYWYPRENQINVSGRHCSYGGDHSWTVYSWNGNAPQEAPLTDDY